MERQESVVNIPEQIFFVQVHLFFVGLLLNVDATQFLEELDQEVAWRWLYTYVSKNEPIFIYTGNTVQCSFLFWGDILNILNFIPVGQTHEQDARRVEAVWAKDHQEMAGEWRLLDRAPHFKKALDDVGIDARQIELQAALVNLSDRVRLNPLSTK